MRYAFGDCVLDTRRRELRRAGALVPLEPQVFDVLAYLVEHRDRVISKDELFDRVWGHRFVGDAALSSRIKAARRAVGDSGTAQRLVKTHYGRGYRFAGSAAPEAGAADTESVPRVDSAPAAGAGWPAPALGTEAGPSPPPHSSPHPLLEGAVTFLGAGFLGAGLPGEAPLADPAGAVRQRDLFRAAVEANGGALLDAAGDVVFAAFADPAPAVAAALAGQLALRREDWRAGGLAGPLRARMALHTGSVARHDGPGDRYAGPTLRRCARLTAAAHGGQVLLSEATAALVRDALPDETDLHDLGLHRLEGQRRPERLYQLVPPQITATFPVLSGAEGPAHNLPRQLTSFVGREREVADVSRFVAGNRLVTLAGPGGCGKTRLALRVAAGALALAPGPGNPGPEAPGPEFRDGVWFVDLAPLSDGALVPQAVAAAAGVREVPGQPLPTILAGALRQHAALVVLDNCEHLLDAVAALAETLLRGAPRVRVLTTSREPLRAAGEAVYRVPPLEAPEAGRAEPPERVARYPAVRLFAQRAAAVRPGFAVTARNAPAVAQVCRRLDGLPLALELAAARVRVLSVEQIAARLDDRLAFLTGGERTASRRQQTLRATLDWSHDLLAGAERTLFRRLAVFAGGFSLAAAEAVGTDETAGPVDGAGTAEGAVGATEALDVLTSLVDRSLVATDAGPAAGAPVPAPTTGGQTADGVDSGEGVGWTDEVRYRLLETVRQYASERLAQSGEVDRVRGAHARHFLALAERAAPEMQGPAQARWHAQLEAEHDNQRAALAWFVEQRDGGHALRLTGALRWFWYRRRYWEEGYAWPARALALPGAQAPTPERATVLQGAGLFAMWRDPAAAHAMWEESAAISLANGAPDRAAATDAFLAWLLIRRGQLEAACARAAAALDLARKADDPSALSSALAVLAAVAARQGQHAAARAHHEEALALRRSTGNASALSLLLLNMAKAAFLAGEGARARALAEDALRTARAAGIRQAVEEELRLIVRVALAEGDLATAEARAGELVTHARGRGTGAEADALALFGGVAQTAGDVPRAVALYQETLQLAQHLPDPGEEHPVLYRDTNDQPGVALALEGTAALLASDQPALALRLGGAAATLRQRTRQPLTPGEQATLDRRLDGAFDRLDRDEATRRWAQGAGATTAEAIALALVALEQIAPRPEVRGPTTPEGLLTGAAPARGAPPRPPGGAAPAGAAGARPD